MSRSQRLLNLIQILRQHRYPITGQSLANELKISLRSVYRDIATLQAQGANIEGESGLGYVLRPGFMLPPLMFSEEEIEALVLGSRWVAQHADQTLKTAAAQVLAKIAHVLPKALHEQMQSSGLMVAPVKNATPMDDENEALVRLAIRKEQKLLLSYIDLKGIKSERIIWPLALGFFEDLRMMISWCEQRADYRHFRTDRILKLTAMNVRYPKCRKNMLKIWREIHHIPDY